MVKKSKVADEEPVAYKSSKKVQALMAKLSMSSVRGNEEMKYLSTGSLGLDYCMGGGIPIGAISSIAGQPSTGKTTLMTMVGASLNREGFSVAYFDFEGAFQVPWATKLGCKVNAVSPEGKRMFDVYRTSSSDKNNDSSGVRTGESMLNLAIAIAEGKDFDVIVIDSLPTIVFQAELEASMEDNQFAIGARNIQKFLKIISTHAVSSGVSIVLVNQLRSVIGGPAYGDPYHEPGGQSVMFYPSVKIRTLAPDIEIEEASKTTTRIIKKITFKVKATKNKVAPPGRIGQIPFIFVNGSPKLNTPLEIYTVGINVGAFRTTGSKPLPANISKDTAFFIGEQLIGKGKTEVIKSLVRDKALRLRLFDIIREEILSLNLEKETHGDVSDMLDIENDIDAIIIEGVG